MVDSAYSSARFDSKQATQQICILLADNIGTETADYSVRLAS